MRIFHRIKQFLISQRMYDWYMRKTGKLDFEHRCVWIDDLKYEMYEENGKRFARVNFTSGRTALYEVESERVSWVFDDTGQRNIKFKFIKFADRISNQPIKEKV